MKFNALGLDVISAYIDLSSKLRKTRIYFVLLSGEIVPHLT